MRQRERGSVVWAVLGPIGAIVGTVVVIGGFAFLIQGTDFFLYRYFAPKREAVRRQVFENTKSHVEGTIQELEESEYEYFHEKDPAAKSVLADRIVRMSADLPDDSVMPEDLRRFISDLRYQRNGGGQ